MSCKKALICSDCGRTSILDREEHESEYHVQLCMKCQKRKELNFKVIEMLATVANILKEVPTKEEPCKITLFNVKEDYTRTEAAECIRKGLIEELEELMLELEQGEEDHG